MKLSLLIGLLLMLSGLANGQEASETRTALPSTEATVRGDLDAEIEDAKMRANSGAKSKFSGSLNMSYNGASLRKPFADVRPNVEGAATESPVTLSGMVGLRYRFDKNTSFFGATGVSKSRPFQNEEGDDWEANNVMMHLNSTFRYDNLQVSSTWLAYVWTQDYLRTVNMVGTAGYSLSVLSQLGQSGFRGGIAGTLSYTYFDGETARFGGQVVDVRSQQEDFTAAIAPSLQYRFNDRFNMYTTVQLFSYGHTRDAADMKLEKRPVSQNLGLGIAVLRDFYLAPNVDFRPGDLSSDQATVNLSAIVNL